MRKITIRNSFLLLFIIFFIIFSVPATHSFAFAETTPDEEVLIGGNPIGIIADTDGLLVTEFVNITTPDGAYSPAMKGGLRKGDIIIAINGEKVTDILRLNEIVQLTDLPLTFTVLRNNNEIIIPVKPANDLVTNAKKLGLMVKNNIAGIGTLTYIRDNNSYGALGHRIADSFGNDSLYKKGKLYLCDISGYKRASAETPGELIGKINLDSPAIGTINKNTFCGIFGNMGDNSSFLSNNRISVGHKSTVKPGKAYIMTTISGNTPNQYEIEIVKAFSQNEPSEKGMVIRVTDKTLLSTTGGILQGMSGSPIIQNGKLIGAVTHVFTNDTTMGYGIYIDWMLNES